MSPVTRRIYVSLPADPWLPQNLNELKWGIVEEIEKLGYTPEIFTNPRGKPGLASAKAWNPRGGYVGEFDANADLGRLHTDESGALLRLEKLSRGTP